MRRVFTLAGEVMAAVLLLSGMGSYAQPKQSDEDLHKLFVSMASANPHICDSIDEQTESGIEKIDDTIVQAAEDRALEALNAGSYKPEKAKAVIEEALAPLERWSEATEGAWPKETRWHFEVTAMLPAVAIQFSHREKSHFRALGVVPASEKIKQSQWQHLGEDSWDGSPFASWSQASLFSLHRGPSGAVRFLVSMQRGGCAGSWGVQYSIEEWNPQRDSYLRERMNQSGVEGLGKEPAQPPSKKIPFPAAGTLKTAGTRIMLPYCQFTGIDTWDNPSLCMVDTYDVSGDAVTFISRRYNRPDLVPVVKVLEYAKAHDLPALRAYCASDVLARKMQRELDGGYSFDTGLEAIKLAPERERVRAEYSDDPGFVVEKRGERWLVTSFDAGKP